MAQQSRYIVLLSLRDLRPTQPLQAIATLEYDTMTRYEQWLISELKTLRFTQQPDENGLSEYDKSQVGFPTQALAQKFLNKIPRHVQQELGLRVEADPAKSTTAILIKHTPFRKLMADDFAAFMSVETAQESTRI